MRARVALALLLTAACSGQAPIREDDPAHLTADLAAALRPAARAWLEDAESREESTELAHPTSMDITAHAIGFERLAQRARATLQPWLPNETRGLPLPAAASPTLRGLAEALATTPRGEVQAEIAQSTASTALVRLRLAPQDRDPASWTLRLERGADGWRFVSLPRRE
jgi:hypothetical protein